MKIKLLAIAAMTVQLGACATVTKGSNDTVKITSEPTGANVDIVDTGAKFSPQTCVTPCSLELNRKQTYKVTVNMDGYSSYETLLTPKLSGDGVAGMAGNVLIGGIIGAGVDASTGAMNDLKPNPLNVTLGKNGQASYATDDNGNQLGTPES